MELGHTSKREIVPDDTLYKCEIYIKFGAREVFFSRAQTELYSTISRLMISTVLLYT
jgi:hypothetical protein